MAGNKAWGEAARKLDFLAANHFQAPGGPVGVNVANLAGALALHGAFARQGKGREML